MIEAHYSGERKLQKGCKRDMFSKPDEECPAGTKRDEFGECVKMVEEPTCPAGMKMDNSTSPPACVADNKENDCNKAGGYWLSGATMTTGPSYAASFAGSWAPD